MHLSDKKINLIFILFFKACILEWPLVIKQMFWVLLAALRLLIKLSPQNNLFPLTRPFAKKSWSIGQKKENRKTD